MFSTPETSVHVLDKNREISPLVRGSCNSELQRRYYISRNEIFISANSPVSRRQIFRPRS